MIDLPTESEMRRALEDRTCIICGVHETQRARYERLGYMAAAPDAEIRDALDRFVARGDPLPKAARQWLARQNVATDQAERLPDA